MSDYASAVTEPFRQRDLPGVHAYLAEAGWTEITGDKSMIAFALLERDLSEQGIADRIWWTLTQLAEHLPRESDFIISIIYDGGRQESLSAKLAVEHADFIHKVFEAKIESQRAMAECADRDRRESEGQANPDLDTFLDL